MKLPARALLFTALVGVSAAVALTTTSGFAERFTDRSGLEAGRFVWQPTAAPEGPVLVIATLGAGNIHVYRGGNLLGIANLNASSGKARPADLPTGVFDLATDGAGRNFLARPLHTVSAGPARVQPLRLPADFARLLADTVRRDSVLLVVAHARTDARLMDANEGVLAALSQPAAAPAAPGAPAVAGWSRPAAAVAHAVSGEAAPGPSALVVPYSGGASAASGPTHVFAYAGASHSAPRWIGFSLGEPSDPGLYAWTGETALAGVTQPAGLDAAPVAPGSALVLTRDTADKSGPIRQRSSFVALAAVGVADEPGEQMQPVSAAAPALLPAAAPLPSPAASPAKPKRPAAKRNAAANRANEPKPFGPEFFAIH